MDERPAKKFKTGTKKKKRSVSKLPELSSETKDAMEKLKNDVEKRAKHNIETMLPQKLVELDRLMQTHPLLKLKSPKEVVEEIVLFDSRKISNQETANGGGNPSSESEKGDPMLHMGVKENSKLAQLLIILKKEVREAVQITSAIKLWIQMLVPKMEDGNNFGVEVQDEVSGELDRVESESYMQMESCLNYHKLRAKYAEKVKKHPHIMDYRQAIVERDQQEYLRRKLALNELRSNYACLYDLITKNLDKVTKPKGETDSGAAFNYM